MQLSKIRMLTVIAIVVLARVASADDAAVLKFRNYSPAQIWQLSEKDRDNQVPTMYIMAARKGLSGGSALAFAMELNSLMYAGLHDYANAVKAFQRDVGDAPSGTLTVWQIYQLEQRSDLQKLTTVGFPQQFSSYISNSYASVEGTIVIVDDSIAWPINHMRVSCTKEDGVCAVNRIYLDTPKENSWAQMYLVGEDIEETYTIFPLD